MILTLSLRKLDRFGEKKMNEIIKSRIIVEVEFNQEKIDFINDAYERGLQYWTRVALESVSAENEMELTELAP